MKNISSLLAKIAVCGLLAVAVPAQGRDAPVENRADIWIKTDLITSYAVNQNLSAFKLDVDVNNGVVTLGGAVKGETERNLAVEMARGTDGVTDVKDNIRVDPKASAGKSSKNSSAGQSLDDAGVTARVKAKLLWNRHTDGLSVKVDTVNGVTTLTGHVDTDAQRDLAEQLTKNTSGVKSVKNSLTVTKDPDSAARGQSNVSNVSDAWITSKVATLLTFSNEADGSDIDVETSDKVVTLTGTVKNSAQKNRVVDLVDDVVGVRTVRTKLEIAAR